LAPEQTPEATLVVVPRLTSSLLTTLRLRADATGAVHEAIFDTRTEGRLSVEVSAFRTVVPAPDAFDVRVPAGTSVQLLPARSLVRSSLF
jgi:hypothetical protein